MRKHLSGVKIIFIIKRVLKELSICVNNEIYQSCIIQFRILEYLISSRLRHWILRFQSVLALNIENLRKIACYFIKFHNFCQTTLLKIVTSRCKDKAELKKRVEIYCNAVKESSS